MVNTIKVKNNYGDNNTNCDTVLPVKRNAKYF